MQTHHAINIQGTFARAVLEGSGASQNSSVRWSPTEHLKHLSTNTTLFSHVSKRMNVAGCTSLLELIFTQRLKVAKLKI